MELRGHIDLLLLSVLAREPLHGYAAIEALRARSGGELDFAEGTIYPALHRLERDGLVTSRWSAGDGRRRRVYELSGAGRAQLVQRRAGWRRLARSVEAVLG